MDSQRLECHEFFINKADEDLLKDTIFLSHANPEDNEFTLWLALQLSKEGYPVWCDLTDLLGGEDIWKDAEKVIREKTVKFLYVLSKKSNEKLGPRNELQTALNTNKQSDIKDFVIPLLVDDLQHSAMNIQLSNLNAIGFKQGWAAGLTALLEKLEKDNVPKNSSFNSNKVSEWWRSHFESDRWLVNEPEEYLSNWFSIEKLPEKIFFHLILRRGVGPIEFKGDFLFPAFNHEQYIVSFAKKSNLEGSVPEPYYIKDSIEVETQVLIDGKVQKIFKPQARIILSYLLNLGWLQMIGRKNLPMYSLSNNKFCGYFSKRVLPDSKVNFKNINGKQTSRKLIGHIGIRKQMKAGGTGAIRYSHFGVSARPMFYPKLGFVIYPHVLFSDDGINIWPDKNKLQKARRRYCSLWWNEHWRDKTLATMGWLADNSSSIELKMGSEVSISVMSSPVLFKSPVSYRVPPKVIKIKEDQYDDEETDETVEGIVSGTDN